MKKTKTRSRKLSLNRETIRSLEDAKLGRARGGVFTQSLVKILTEFPTDPCTLGASCGPFCPGPYTGN